MVGLAIRIEGDRAIERELGRLQARLGNLSPLMERIGMVLEESVLHRFETETAPDGRRWQPSIRARETGGKTLTDSARLKLSISYQASGDRVEVGTNVKYGAPHQFGATIRGRNGPLRFKLPGGLGFRTVAQVVLPARPFLGFSAEDETEIEAQVEDYAAEAAPGLFGGAA